MKRKKLLFWQYAEKLIWLIIPYIIGGIIYPPLFLYSFSYAIVLGTIMGLDEISEIDPILKPILKRVIIILVSLQIILPILSIYTKNVWLEKFFLWIFHSDTVAEDPASESLGFLMVKIIYTLSGLISISAAVTIIYKKLKGVKKYEENLDKGEELTGNARIISVVLFGIALSCFLLPFIDIYCRELNTSTFIGFQLFWRITVNNQKISVMPLPCLIFLVIGVGGNLGLMKVRKWPLGSCITALTGLILLSLLKVKLDNELYRIGGVLFQANYTTGFWLLFLFLCVAVVWNAFILFKNKEELPAIDFYIFLILLGLVDMAIMGLGVLFLLKYAEFSNFILCR